MSSASTKELSAFGKRIGAEVLNKLITIELGYDFDGNFDSLTEENAKKILWKLREVIKAWYAYSQIIELNEFIDWLPGKERFASCADFYSLFYNIHSIDEQLFTEFSSFDWIDEEWSYRFHEMSIPWADCNGDVLLGYADDLFQGSLKEILRHFRSALKRNDIFIFTETQGNGQIRYLIYFWTTRKNWTLWLNGRFQEEDADIRSGFYITFRAEKNRLYILSKYPKQESKVSQLFRSVEAWIYQRSWTKVIVWAELSIFKLSLLSWLTPPSSPPSGISFDSISFYSPSYDSNIVVSNNDALWKFRRNVKEIEEGAQIHEIWMRQDISWKNVLKCFIKPDRIQILSWTLLRSINILEELSLVNFDTINFSLSECLKRAFFWENIVGDEIFSAINFKEFFKNHSDSIFDEKTQTILPRGSKLWGQNWILVDSDTKVELDSEKIIKKIFWAKACLVSDPNCKWFYLNWERSTVVLFFKNLDDFKESKAFDGKRKIVFLFENADKIPFSYFLKEKRAAIFDKYFIRDFVQEKEKFINIWWFRYGNPTSFSYKTKTKEVWLNTIDFSDLAINWTEEFEWVMKWQLFEYFSAVVLSAVFDKVIPLWWSHSSWLALPDWLLFDHSDKKETMLLFDTKTTKHQPQNYVNNERRKFDDYIDTFEVSWKPTFLIIGPEAANDIWKYFMESTFWKSSVQKGCRYIYIWDKFLTLLQRIILHPEYHFLSPHLKKGKFLSAILSKEYAAFKHLKFSDLVKSVKSLWAVLLPNDTNNWSYSSLWKVRDVILEKGGNDINQNVENFWKFILNEIDSLEA